VLHVLNGDATAGIFQRSGIHGDQVVWRDIRVEGPVSADDDTLAARQARAAYLAARFDIDGDAYLRAADEQAQALAVAGHHDEVVLWFEQDLFCAVTLWRLLDRLARLRSSAAASPSSVRLSLVYPTLDEYTGLGRAAPEHLAALFAERRPVSDRALVLGQRAWSAYASADPLHCARLAAREDGALPFVRAAFRCHLGRFPSVANGLNEVETATLSALLRAPQTFAALFREVSVQPRVRAHGMGDVQFAACLRGLEPLVRLAGERVTDAEVELTPVGRAVLAGLTDRLDVRPLETWLGGVRLAPGRALWRWDGARDRLVRSAAV
jgi:hypothetical protein